MNDIEDIENSENKEENEVLKSKIDDLEDKLLRTVAESQNLKKRLEKEKEDFAKYSISKFAKDVLTIRDNLCLALASSKESDKNTIFDGIKLTLAEMDKILASYSVEIIDSLGKEFDPYLHQAMLEIPSPDDKKKGIIVEVMQDGFMIHDRLLRPSLVAVSKKS